MALLCGRAGRLTAENGGFWPGQWDVTAQLNSVVGAGGKAHAVGVSLGDGWYAQATVKVGKPQMLLLLSVEYADGTSEEVVSDTSWTVGPSPVTQVDIYDGEHYDASKETPGWTAAGFTAPAGWAPAAAVAAPSPHVKVTSHAIRLGPPGAVKQPQRFPQ